MNFSGTERHRAVIRRARWTVTLAVFIVVVVGLVGCLGVRPGARTVHVPLHYPATAKVSQVDDYHGTKVADPYRWLEDDNSPETLAWVEAQNKVTFAFLAGIPAREPLRKRLTQLWNYERYGVPFKKGGRYFYTRNDGLQNQSVLYTLEQLNGVPKVLLDPNTMSDDGTMALTRSEVSDDGKYLAYAISTAGSDWQEWRVRDVATARDFDDEIKWSKFSGAAWSRDSQGFFYSRYDAPKPGEERKGINYFQKLDHHSLGQPQTADRLVYHRPDHKEWGFGGEVTDDGAYLVINVWRGSESKSQIFYQELKSPTNEVVELITGFDADYQFIGNVGGLFYFLSDQGAPRGRIIAVDLARPDRAQWREVVPASKDRLESVSLLNDQFVAVYLQDAHSIVKIFDREGKLARDLPLNGLGTVSGFSGRRQDEETFYRFTSFTEPGTIYRYDLRNGQSSVFREPKLRFDPKQYVTRQIFYESKDETKVPMYLVHRRGIKLDRENPTYLYGYGGFDNALTPQFSVSVLTWMEMGGVYAQPGLRGGGEYGVEWHEAGMRHNKQRVFDDFIAAAEWLINSKYTRPGKLAIGGGSNGGLLVGACITQRPELFGAALPAVGVMDMLRFHKFTIGWAWTSEYGSSDNAADFKTLYEYSPLHRITAGRTYPATLITTADHDDRVVPAHSFKFAAALQAAQSVGPPVLIRIETRAGHGAGKPTSKQIEEAADRWAFLTRELQIN